MSSRAEPAWAGEVRCAPCTASKLNWADASLLAGIVLLAAGLRFAYVEQLRENPLFDNPLMDEHYHDQWAQAAAEGRTFMEGPYFRAPLYPWFLAAIYRVFGHDYLIPRLIQSGLGALSCGVLFLIGRRVFGRLVGAVAGACAATYWILIYFDGELLIPTLLVFLDLLLILVLLGAGSRPKAWKFALAGALLGVSALARPNILLLGPALVGWLLIVHRRELRRGVAFATALTAGCLLPILPVTVRNYVVGGDLVLISSQGGVNFYIGNNPRSDGRTAIVPGTPGGWWEGYHAANARAEKAVGRELRPSEVSGYYFAESMRWIRERPEDFLAHLWLKTRLFFSSWEISNNKGIYFWTEQFTPMVRLLPLGFAVIGPLGLAGLLLAAGRGRAPFPLWGFVLVYSASVILFFCTSRYRVPVLPPLILFASYFGVEVVRSLRARAWTGLAFAGPAVAAAALLVNLPLGPPEMFRNDAFSHVRLAAHFTRHGEYDLAIEHYEAALAEAPTLLIAHYQLATVFHHQGRLEEAIESYREAIACRPKLSSETPQMVAKAHLNLARALDQQGRRAEAEVHLAAATAMDPSLGR